MENYQTLTDEQFALIEPILKEERDFWGRKPIITDHQVLDAFFYILHKGCRWRALPPHFGQWMALFMRYKRWVERGMVWKILMRLQRANVLKVTIAFMDSAVVRAHRHASGASKKGEYVRRRDALVTAWEQNFICLWMKPDGSYTFLFLLEGQVIMLMRWH